MATKMQTLAQEALFVQGAYNPIALANSYGKTILKLREALQEEGSASDHEAIRKHPVNRLWVSKLHDMASMGMSDADQYADAYNWCQEQVNRAAVS